MRLSDLETGDKTVVVKVYGHGGFRKRIVEMGFTKGKVIERLRCAPLQDPVEYNLMGYNVSLRVNEARNIEVVSLAEAQSLQDKEYHGTITEQDISRLVQDKRKNIVVALVGNPNAGKTSLFNIASGKHEKVGNYSGVTVDSKAAYLDHKGYRIKIVDLPGTYSLSAYTPEETYVRRQLVSNPPDLVINVVDASNLERNLYLTTQLLDMNIPMVIALNMYDELEKRGDRFDYNALAGMIGVPMVPTVSTRKIGIEKLFDTVISIYEGEFAEKGEHDGEACRIIRHIHINYGPVIEDAIFRLKSRITGISGFGTDFTPRYVAIKLLEEDKEMEEYMGRYAECNDVLSFRNQLNAKISSLLHDTAENVIMDAKYGFINGALKENFVSATKERGKTLSSRIDDIVTSKVWGYPIFLLVVFVMFQATFSLGQYPQEWIESFIGWVSSGIASILPSGILKDLIVDGIIAGIGSVLVFLPNILILYLFISLMESSGYMARTAFIMDKIMHKIGLHGRSFIPLMMGFGCNVPAIMATRTIQNYNNRMVTILISPLISCSARLPVYLLLAGTFFPNKAGFVLFGIYLTGILLAALMAVVLKKSFFTKEETPFVMELPPYRFPSLRSIVVDTWDKAKQYLHKIGSVILVASIVIWFLSYFPRTVKVQEGTEMTVEQINMQQQNSFLGRTGRFIQPVLEPLGFDWKTSVSLLTGVAAKEIVVSTLSVLHNVEGDDESGMALSERLKTAVDENGNAVFTPAVALSLLLFMLIYFPCIATIATIKNETGSWKWALFTIGYTLVLAWIVSFTVYQSVVNDIWQQMLVVVIIILALAFIVRNIRRTLRRKNSCGSCCNCSVKGCPSRDNDCKIKK